jgi:hypothetical protein
MHNYTPWLAGMTKNADTIIKPTRTPINRKKYVSGSVNSEGHVKKIKNQARRSLRPISIQLCHQKPNTARETLPLKKKFLKIPGKKGKWNCHQFANFPNWLNFILIPKEYRREVFM